MYYLTTFFIGVLTSVMIALNGGMSEFHGVYTTALFIHISGLLVISALVLCKHEHPFANRQKPILYLGGAVGVMIAVFLNLSYGRISVSTITALVLLGQSITSLVIDQYGLLHMPKHPFHTNKIIGLFLIAIGIVSIIDNYDGIAILLSFFAGTGIVIARSFNAKLSELTSVGISTFYNYLTGFIVVIPVWLLLGSNEVIAKEFLFSSQWYIYLGGVVGVCIIMLNNIVVMKITALYMSLLLFIGQVFSSIFIDMYILQFFSTRNLIGGIFVVVGLCVNLVMDTKRNADTQIKLKFRQKVFFNPLFATRPNHIIICPCCGTEQSKELDFCVSCEITFYFLDETNKITPGL